MVDRISRREFMGRAAAGAVAGGAIVGKGTLGATEPARAAGASQEGVGPVVVSSANGVETVKLARELMLKGTDPLEAAIAGVNKVEENPDDMTVGWGGLPNEDGVVELDSAVMHGPTHNAGSVGALRHIKTPSKVAYLVMKYTDHVMLVGEGALRFAKSWGFKEEDLLTDKARKVWLYWKSKISDRDDRFPDESLRDDPQVGKMVSSMFRTHGTIHCSALDGNGDLGCVTTTSGLAFKIPGRVGDSPIIGAGLYCDNEVGSAGATGRGEAVILAAGSAMVVERMRAGLEPEEACLEVLGRIAKQARRYKLVKADGTPEFSDRFYALRKDGKWGGAALVGKGKMAVADANGARLEDIPGLFA